MSTVACRVGSRHIARRLRSPQNLVRRLVYTPTVLPLLGGAAVASFLRPVAFCAGGEPDAAAPEPEPRGSPDSGLPADAPADDAAA
eukprot:SAG11_NODE_12672_length_691_cov_1.243243_1_plen_85_part_10